MILDENFNEVKRITFEASDTVEKGHPLDGHDFLMVDLDHYFLSGYIKDTVYNIPDYPDGSSVVYSYLQEVQDGKVVWDFKTVDYPELYQLTVTDGKKDANDFGNVTTDVPDYVHFNAMRLTEDGDLIVSYRHLSSILCLDRTKKTDQIKWFLSGGNDQFGLCEVEKTNCQHYVTWDGNYIMTFDNHNSNQASRVVCYYVDTDAKKLKAFRGYAVGNKFSMACGSAQRVKDELFVIGWGCAAKDADCMSVVDFSTGDTLLNVTLDNPQDFTYRCVYYE
ncbi:MAG: aryl-sulfate sulfotransferase [Lachnospiraceae bacterium]|nr:aryl-sulfate sulfotransferase [Lachnospiraceae bacterium]